MNILVIGNGFDLAHGLPTKYTDFLEFCKMAREIYESEKIDSHHYEAIYLEESNLNEEIKRQLLSIFASRKVRRGINNNDDMKYTITSDYPKSDELYALIKDNFWIEFFQQCDMHGDENWIDFESEISEVIQSIDGDMQGLDQVYDIEDIVSDLSNDFLKDKYSDYIDAVQPINPVDNGFSEGITFKELRDRLLMDLNRLIRALEIYLCDYVEKIEIQEKSPDIGGLNIDFILSFNYTHTFSKLYDVSAVSKQEIAAPFDYIHGEADINNTIDSNNMVLGIDEYLSKKRKNKYVEFIAFKKYYQRIYKGTGSMYKDWINAIRKENDIYMEKKHDCEIYLENIEVLDNIKEEMRVKLKQLNENPPRHNLYIFGHSLDITDKDVLRDMILNDNVYTKIYYHKTYNENGKDDNGRIDLGSKIANLVKVIGQDELIRRTGGSTKTIEFKLQQDMISAIN